MRKNALITGGSRGIGKAIALQLAKDNFTIYLNYKSNHQKANEVKTEIENLNSTCHLIPFDVSSFQACQDALKDFNNKEHYFSVVINNAGIRKDNLLFWMEETEWKDVIETNLSSNFNIIKATVPGMISAKQGTIINITSTSGLSGMAGQVNYSAAKAGQIGITKSLALELGKKGIRVNAVAPGFIDTDLTEDLPLKEIKKRIPLKRFGKVEDVANLVSFLCSDKSSYITGQTISINGGIYI